MCATRRSRPRVVVVAACLIGIGLPGIAARADAQIRVNPTGVNVNTQGATTVFLTFGGVRNHEPVEALWCGALVPAAPDTGQRCDPSTIFGALPVRLNQSQASGTNGFTDIMSIPPTVTRRAYQAAAAGENSAFFYVRRFRSLSGGPDQYVAVTCRLAGGGARTPFALTDVYLKFESDTPVGTVSARGQLPAVRAELQFTGTGRLQGRWEIVRPGEPQPEPFDLLPEGTLPVEQRGQQRRYAEITRFNTFLPPTGRYTLAGPDPARLPTDLEGTYLLLLRIEVVDDKEGDSNLTAAGAGVGVVHSGGLAGFPMPVLRYVVGAGGGEAADALAPGVLALVDPPAGAIVASPSPRFSWRALPQAAVHRLEVVDETGAAVFSAMTTAPVSTYVAPPWLRDKAGGRPLRWRVAAISTTGAVIRRSEWRDVRVARQP
jgi:hypothetical protein